LALRLLQYVAAATSFSMVMRLFPGRTSFAIICCALISVCSLVAGCLCFVVQHTWFSTLGMTHVSLLPQPCRYFAETSATLFTTILGQRDSRAADGQPFRDYWLSDGTYGSFRIQVSQVLLITPAGDLLPGCS
jgi:hypothetical protein